MTKIKSDRQKKVHKEEHVNCGGKKAEERDEDESKKGPTDRKPGVN